MKTLSPMGKELGSQFSSDGLALQGWSGLYLERDNATA